MKNKNIIAIESSTEFCSISILYKNKIYSKYKYSYKNNCKYILEMINNTIKKNKIHIKNINILSYNIGPGSIIGTRLPKIIFNLIKIKYPKIKIIKINSQEIIKKKYYLKYKNKNIYIIIYISIYIIYIYKYKKNKLYYSKCINNKKIKKFIKNKKNINIVVNSTQTKQKLLSIINDKNFNYNAQITVIYPTSKYIIDMLKIC